MVTLTDILPRLQNIKERPGGYIAACPVCKDDKHLYVTPAQDKVLMYCQKCNAQYPQIIASLNMPEDAGRIARPARRTAAPTKTTIEKYDHVYRNADGSTAYYKTRQKYSDGSKRFSFWHEADGVRNFTRPENAMLLYNHDLMEKTPAETRLYIVEGEKCADALTKHGYLATTTNTGGGRRKIRFTAEDQRLLDKFGEQVIIPDNDIPGEEYTESFQQAHILRMTDIWPECPAKGDIADYIDAGLPLSVLDEWTPQEDACPSGAYETITHDDVISRELYDYLSGITDVVERSAETMRIRNMAKASGWARDFDTMRRAVTSQRIKSGDLSDGGVTQFTGQPLTLSCGEWTATDGGVYRYKTNASGNLIPEHACSIPIMPVEILENATTNVEKITLAYRPDGRWKTVTVERIIVSSANKILELANRGIPVNSENAKLLITYIADVLAQNRGTIPRLLAVSKLGWLKSDGETSFVPYDDDIRFDGDDEYKYLYRAISTAGSLEEWKKTIAPLRENILFRLCMAASFASPIIELCHGLPFVFHLWGGTGSGKTVALMAAMSIWGDPALGKTVRTMNMTANSMMATAAFLNSLPFAGDELQTIKSRWENYDRLIISVTEGIDRGRMTYDKINETKSWKCAFLFTGEEPAAKSASGGGVKNRIIECECTDVLVPNGNKVVAAITENHGHAGREYINFIREQDDLYPGYQAYFTKIIAETDTTDKQAMAMAMMMVADVYASSLLFPGERPLSIADVAPYLTSARDVDVAERAYQFTVNLCAQNENRFGTMETGEVWGRLEHGGRRVVINKGVLVKKLAEEGYDYEAVKKAWAKKGYIELTNRMKYQHWTTYNKVAAWCIRVNILPMAESD